VCQGRDQRAARWCDASADLPKGTGVVSCANALTAVIRHTKLTGVDSHAGVIGTTCTGAPQHDTGAS